MAFAVIPSLFLYNGECVYFPDGDHRKITVHPYDPLTTARQWISSGAAAIDIVDLNAVKGGYPTNLELTCGLVATVDVPVQVGGGIRDLSIMETLVQAGAHQLVLGTAAVCDPHFVEEAVVTYGDRIAIALDTRHGRVAIRGGQELSVRGTQDVFQSMMQLGVYRFIYSDLGRNGSLNLNEIRHLLNLYPDHCQMYVKGAATAQDLQQLADLHVAGLAGAIVGEPLYTGQLSLEQALWLVAEDRLPSEFLPPISDNSA